MPGRSRRHGKFAAPYVVALFLAVSAVIAEAQSECPRRFDQQTTGMPSACVFVGRYNPTCGGEAFALFAGDGRALVVSLSASAAAAPLFMPAHVLSATEGKLVMWRSDIELDQAPNAGSVRLEDGGQHRRVRVASGKLLAAGCPFAAFVGRFVGMAVAGARSVEQIALYH